MDFLSRKACNKIVCARHLKRGKKVEVSRKLWLALPQATGFGCYEIMIIIIMMVMMIMIII